MLFLLATMLTLNYAIIDTPFVLDLDTTQRFLIKLGENSNGSLLPSWLVFSYFLFLCGLLGMIFNYKNFLVTMMSVELMYLGAISSFVLFGTVCHDSRGPIYGLLLLILAACESAVGLGILIVLHRFGHSIDFSAYCGLLKNTSDSIKTIGISLPKFQFTPLLLITTYTGSSVPTFDFVAEFSQYINIFMFLLPPTAAAASLLLLCWLRLCPQRGVVPQCGLCNALWFWPFAKKPPTAEELLRAAIKEHEQNGDITTRQGRELWDEFRLNPVWDPVAFEKGVQRYTSVGDSFRALVTQYPPTVKWPPQGWPYLYDDVIRSKEYLECWHSPELSILLRATYSNTYTDLLISSGYGNILIYLQIAWIFTLLVLYPFLLVHLWWTSDMKDIYFMRSVYKGMKELKKWFSDRTIR